MADFDKAIAVLLSDEGSVYIPNDHGRGPSKWGITWLTAQEIEPEWSATTIESLTRDQACDFYQKWAWQGAHIGLIRDQELATKLLDLGVNIGLGKAIEFLQRGLGVACDGILGPLTASAANLAEPNFVIAAMITAGRAYYDQIVAHDRLQQKNYPGWIARLERRYPDGEAA